MVKESADFVGGPSGLVGIEVAIGMGPGCTGVNSYP